MNVVVVKFLMLCTKFHCFTFNLGLSMCNLSFIPQFLNFYDVRLNHALYSCSIGSANSSVGRVSDCIRSSEGRRFEPSLVDTKLRQLSW